MELLGVSISLTRSSFVRTFTCQTTKHLLCLLTTGMFFILLLLSFFRHPKAREESSRVDWKYNRATNLRDLWCFLLCMWLELILLDMIIRSKKKYLTSLRSATLRNFTSMYSPTYYKAIKEYISQALEFLPKKRFFCYLGIKAYEA